MRKLPTKKILIIRFSSIGDIVLTTPVVRAIKTQSENTEVHYCTKKAYRHVIENNPYVDKILTLEEGLWTLIQTIRKQNYSQIIDLHKNLRTFIIRAALFKKFYSYPKANFEKWLYINFRINRLPNKHIVDRYFDAARPLGFKPDTLGLDYFISDENIIERDWLPLSHQKEYTAFAIGGSHFTKRLPFIRLVEVCRLIDGPIILLGGKEDADIGEKIFDFFHKNPENTAEPSVEAEKLNGNTSIFNACGKLNLDQSASVVKGAKYVFTHDTGLMHIAAAFKKEIFSIWGHTIPEFGMYPYRTKFTIFENKNAVCRPCTKIGKSSCPKGHFNCMNGIKFQ